MDRKKVIGLLEQGRWYSAEALAQLHSGVEDYSDLKLNIEMALRKFGLAVHEAQTSSLENTEDQTKDIIEKEPPRPSKSEFFNRSYPPIGARYDTIPWAIVDNVTMKVRGSRTKNRPRGLVVHWTSGSSAESSMQWGAKQGYHFAMINMKGKLSVPYGFELHEWGYHAGTSNWPNINCSKDLLGVEIDNGSKLTEKNGKYFTWFDEEIPKERVRFVAAEDNMVRGYYEQYTEEQEQTLIYLCLWLKMNDPDWFSFDYVLGHDEVAGDENRLCYGPGKGISYQRKTDPGGALSMTMPKFREMLKEKYEELLIEINKGE